MSEWTDEQKALRKSLDQYFERAQRRPHRGRREQRLPAREVGADPRDRRHRAAVRPGVGRARPGRADDGLRARAPRLRLPGRGLLFSVATQIVSVAAPDPASSAPTTLKERYLRRLIDGSIISAHAISEPEAGSDATGDVHDRDRGRRLLRHQRQEGVLHERAGRRRDHGLREAGGRGRRDRHHRVPGRDRHARHQRRRADPEDGAEHLADRRARVRATAACRRRT